jgi:pimeloyl-ACP methyl ester carboxylesterase
MALPTVGAIAASCALAALLYLGAVRWFLRLRGERPERLTVRTADGWALAVHYRPARPRRYREPVLLCHGLATSHLNLDFEPPYSLALAFAGAGFETFAVDWRGAGHSRPPPGRGRFDFDADDLIERDAPAALDLVLARAGAERAFWVGHSLGGLVGYAVAGGPGAARIGALCALGSPVYFHHPPWLVRAMRLCRWLSWPYALRQRLLSIAGAPFLGRAPLPFSDVLLNPKAIAPPVLRRIHANLIESMGHRLLKQLDDWSQLDRFCSRDGAVDYRGRLSDVRQPTLVLGGSADRLAPPSSIHGQLALLGPGDRTLMLFGTENGEQLEYGHGDLLLGTGAPSEVYPRILTWFRERATPLPSAR